MLVTAGATEALAATLLALVEPGDEVITFEPFYDAYGALIRLAGATHVTVPLTAPDFLPDEATLRAAFTDRTRAVLVNTPHNPTGRVLPAEVLTTVVELAEQHDAVIVTDEVYEHLTFDVPHVPIASLPGAADRTVTVSSAGKTFSTTGWKIGWLTAPPALVDAITTVKQYLTFVNGAPFQPAVATGLRLPDTVFTGIAAELSAKHDLLAAGLRAAGFDVLRPDGGYFVLADTAPLGYADAREFCLRCPRRRGRRGPGLRVRPPDHAAGYRSLVRFAFCKQRAVLEDAAAASRVSPAAPEAWRHDSPPRRRSGRSTRRVTDATITGELLRASRLVTEHHVVPSQRQRRVGLPDRLGDRGVDGGDEGARNGSGRCDGHAGGVEHHRPADADRRGLPDADDQTVFSIARAVRSVRQWCSLPGPRTHSAGRTTTSAAPCSGAARRRVTSGNRKS